MSNKKRIGIGLGLTAAGLLTGTAVVFMLTGPQSAVATAGPALDRPVPVEVTVVERTRMRLWSGFSARLAAVDEVLVRPQVSGKIVEVRFSDGETVNKDQVLFVIDPRPYTATVNRAKAELVAARDRHTLAKKELDRARELLASKHISKQAADELESVFAVRASEVEAAAARLEQAQIDLDYAFVKAPIAGRASRAEVTVGNIVQAGNDAPLLTTIVSNEGIYAEFEVDEATYLRHVRSGARDVTAERDIPVRLVIDGLEGRPYEGRVHTFDNRIDTGTGTIRARALFDNADGTLLPGMFARIELGSAVERPIVLLRQDAVLTDQDRRFVYVVDAEGNASYRQVTLGESVDARRVITSGLNDGDRVIVSGIMAVRPGVPVDARVMAEQSADPGTTMRVSTSPRTEPFE